MRHVNPVWLLVAVVVAICALAALGPSAALAGPPAGDTPTPTATPAPPTETPTTAPTETPTTVAPTETPTTVAPTSVPPTEVPAPAPSATPEPGPSATPTPVMEITVEPTATMPPAVLPVTGNESSVGSIPAALAAAGLLLAAGAITLLWRLSSSDSSVR